VPDDVSDIHAFYDDYAEQEDGRLERHQLERDVTWRYLDKYLPARGKILEIGAGTGAYTIPLARRGYMVTASDLTPKLVEICQKRVVEEGLERNVTCHAADARDLSDVPGTGYDAVLLMGPLYHLVLDEDRRKALAEASSRLRPGGVLFSTMVSRYGIWGQVMRDIPHFVENRAGVWMVLDEGRDTEVPTYKQGFRGYFATVPEIIPLHEKIGLKTLVLAGVEPGGVYDQVYNGLEGERRRLWLDLLFTISAEPSIVGASCHLLYIGVKE
jgi:S-adenosylmethionine-dependent methyltransferase